MVTLSGIDGKNKRIIENNTKAFLDAINIAYRRNNQPVIPQKIADDNVITKLSALWSSSSFISVKPNIIENVLFTSQGNYEVRNLQIVFEEALEGYEQKDAVLIFNKNGMIVDFKVALSQSQIRSIMNDTINVIDYRRRERIIDFTENLLTAYLSKDLNFVSAVLRNKLEPEVIYRKQTISEYLSKLKVISERSSMLNINFIDVKVITHPEYSKIYAIRITKEWHTELIQSGKYHDLGYLFLIIDFSVEEAPKIWVCVCDSQDTYPLDYFKYN